MLVQELLNKENMNIVGCVRIYSGENLIDDFSPISEPIYKEGTNDFAIPKNCLQKTVDRFELDNLSEFYETECSEKHCKGKFLRILVE